MMPTFRNGANTAERAPITTFTSPRLAMRQESNLSPSESALCMTATLRPNLALTLFTRRGVRDISGTRSIASFPLFMTSSIARRYTSVFPLPVTPWSKNGANFPLSTASLIFPHAISWSIVSTGLMSPFISIPPNGSLDISSCSVTMNLFSSSHARCALTFPNTSLRSSSGTLPLPITNSRI